jgi:hypothetical protein
VNYLTFARRPLLKKPGFKGSGAGRERQEEEFMNDLRFVFRQLGKNPGFTLVAVLTPALQADAASRFGLAGSGIEPTDSRNLSGIQQVPIAAHPDHEEFGASFWGHIHVFGMAHRENFAIGKMQSEWTKGCPIPHLLQFRDFHLLPDNRGLTQIFN